MGAWGEGTFDNDTACDWAGDLEGARDLSLVQQAIDEVLATGSDYLDSDLASEALAACEVIARLQGRWGKRNAYSETVDTWVAAHPAQPSEALVQRAAAAIDRVLADDSELRELWDEGGRNEAWHTAVQDLRRRVTG